MSENNGTLLTERERELLSYCQHGVLSRQEIADAMGISVNTVKAHLYRIFNKLGVGSLEDAVGAANQGNELVMPTGEPSHPELYQILKKGAISLNALSVKFDRSEATILEWIKEMEEEGYAIEREKHYVRISDQPKPGQNLIEPQIDWQRYKYIKFGVFSDLHAGSSCSQPTALNAFIRTAVDEGVRHFFVPGDVSTGMRGYRGQEYDLIPSCKPGLAKEDHLVAQKQVWLIDKYIPQIDGVTYYMLGGNHDWWHVKYAGIDVLRLITDKRPDMVYLGYDVADVPLTEKISARLSHPRGGVPYAVSYRLQKHVEQIAFQQLIGMVEEGLPPSIRFLFLGHLHIEVEARLGSIVGSQVGCFEGQTNYLKSKGLFPVIGGQIWEVCLSAKGEIRRVSYEFISFPEIEDDWKNWPTPPDPTIIGQPELPEVLFKLVEADV